MKQINSFKAVNAYLKKAPQFNVHRNFIPCNSHFCSCIINRNIKDSYSDRYHYKKCFDRNMNFYKKNK